MRKGYMLYFKVVSGAYSRQVGIWEEFFTKMDNDF